MRDVPLDVDVDQLVLGGWDAERAEATFEEYEMKTVWQRLAELIDAGALGAPARRQRHPHDRAWPAAAAAAADAEPAPAPLEVRDVALPTNATEAAKQLGELGQGRLAVAGRWNGLPGAQRPGRAARPGHRG